MNRSAQGSREGIEVGRRLIRPVSARYMHTQEIGAYEKGAQAQYR